MADMYELNPASQITVGTIGEPGQRTFYLQGSKGTRVVSLVIEKEQAAALANALDEFLEKLEEEQELPPPRPDTIDPVDLNLRQPVEGLFRVGQIGLGYDDESDLVLIAAQELVLEEEIQSPRVARLWGTRTQMAALSEHAVNVVNAGRPSCPLCGEPIDPDGHFCPRSNGHAKD